MKHVRGRSAGPNRRLLRHPSQGSARCPKPRKGPQGNLHQMSPVSVGASYTGCWMPPTTAQRQRSPSAMVQSITAAPDASVSAIVASVQLLATTSTSAPCPTKGFRQAVSRSASLRAGLPQDNLSTPTRRELKHRGFCGKARQHS